MDEHISTSATRAPQPGTGPNAPGSDAARLERPSVVPGPESAVEVGRWADSEDLRRTELVYAPAFWVLLPLAAIAFLVHQAVTDPTGAGWNIAFNGESRDTWPSWVPCGAWIGVSVWLLAAIGVLLFRLSILRDLQAENRWIYEHGVAHSIHRASIDYDDGEDTWATYIALDHRVHDKQAETIHRAFEEWLRSTGLPPSGSAPISSAALFGPQMKGGYFILHPPMSRVAGSDTGHRWVLITEPRRAADDVIVTPIPEPKKLARIRRRLSRKADHRSAL
ncbi:hypothetical protein SAMN04488550_4314 [Gordonia malaquae]|uniref:Uncharacterized protein n=1 Tax=Gordonia malaquae NBRC 108250 TaxID=1223542 RepID=M3VEJ8_GORML|nr:hypothetical protein [Gordonia malaquae]GAC79324.1 hypothetical protein GM1_008_00860 [Gordonia malaquae NBRC 108250]SEE33281.1 hypothetical protein SAMN04488550_4314 [Gordonia malaquae]